VGVEVPEWGLGGSFGCGHIDAARIQRSTSWHRRKKSHRYSQNRPCAPSRRIRGLRARHRRSAAYLASATRPVHPHLTKRSIRKPLLLALTTPANAYLTFLYPCIWAMRQGVSELGHLLQLAHFANPSPALRRAPPPCAAVGTGIGAKLLAQHAGLSSFSGSATELTTGPDRRNRATVLAAVKDATRRLCGGREERPSLTATAHGGSERVQVGTEGWPRSNKRIGTKHFPERNTAPSLQSPCRLISARGGTRLDAL
jgi:hypothetical protein